MYERFRPFTEISQDGRGLPSFFRSTHTPCRLIRRQLYSLWRRASTWKVSLSSWRLFFFFTAKKRSRGQVSFSIFLHYVDKTKFLCFTLGRSFFRNQPLLPGEQRFFSCMAFSVYEVVQVACLSRSWFVYAKAMQEKKNPARRVTTSFILRSCVTKFYNNSYRKNCHQTE